MDEGGQQAQEQQIGSQKKARVGQEEALVALPHAVVDDGAVVVEALHAPAPTRHYVNRFDDRVVLSSPPNPLSPPLSLSLSSSSSCTFGHEAHLSGVDPRTAMAETLGKHITAGGFLQNGDGVGGAAHWDILTTLSAHAACTGY